MIDIRDNLRDDERRRREEARLGALQEQIDELRLLLREGGSRQAKTEEAQVALAERVQGLGERLETVRHEARGALDARSVDLTRLRGEVEDAEARQAASVAPLPGLQAQISDLGNQLRTKLQELGDERRRFDELQAQIDRFPPQVERSADVARAVREELADVRGEIDGLRVDWRKVNDAVGIAEQEVRRRAGETVGLFEETNGRIAALKDALPPLEAQIARLRGEVQAALPQIEQATAAIAELREDIDRNAIVAVERHTQAMAHADEVRAGMDERIRLVERLNDTRFTSTMARFGELEEADRGIGHRITLLAVRLDELRAQDAELRVEMRHLEELRLRVRIEQAQQEAQLFTARLAELQARADGDEEE